MDHVERTMAEFNARRNSSARSKIDALLDIEQLTESRVLAFLLNVAIDTRETAEVRTHVIRLLRHRRYTSEDDRLSVADAIGRVLTGGPGLGLRAQSALSLAEFTDVEGVVRMLGAVALDEAEPL